MSVSEVGLGLVDMRDTSVEGPVPDSTGPSLGLGTQCFSTNFGDLSYL